MPGYREGQTATLADGSKAVFTNGQWIGSALPKITESQSKDGRNASKMDRANQTISGIEGDPNFNPTLSAVGAFMGRTPLGMMGVGAKSQEYEQAKHEYDTALLRMDSGAAISKGEESSYDHTYFPQPGDTPDVVKQKAAARAAATKDALRNAGPGAPPRTNINTAPVAPPRTKPPGQMSNAELKAALGFQE